tara:strand:+ start:621 stop:920 length:300 start_codon:yes stop_codon:yes gene_type:complete
MNDLFGTETFKLVRRESPPTSYEAADSIDTTKLEKMVYETIKAFGSTGCISDEVQSRLPHLAYSSVTARFKALIDKNLVMVSGKRKGRSGRSQRVMVAT